MDRTSARALALAAVAILALGVAAATLDSPTMPEAGSPSGGAPDSSGPINVSSGSPPSGGGGGITNGTGTTFSLPCFEVLLSPFVQLGLVFLLLAIAGFLYWKTRSTIVSLGVTTGIAIPLVLLYTIFTSCGSGGSSSRGGLPFLGANQSLPLSQGGGGTAGQAVSTPSFLLGILLLLAVLGTVFLLVFSTGNDTDLPEEPEEPAESTVDVAAVGQAAGEAADRIEETADVANEVYRAWAEMTDHLDVSNPDSSTPAEFASAAVDAGMAPEDVNELTNLFEEVRYGGADPTDEREHRAIDALRRIEDMYAEDGRDQS